jgi:hypothetical protein
MTSPSPVTTCRYQWITKRVSMTAGEEGLSGFAIPPWRVAGWLPNFLTQDETGQWIPPSASSGGANHEWILSRPKYGAEYQDWRASELVLVGGQWGFVQGDWLTDLTVMASRVVVEVGVTYAGQEFHRKVPPNGVLTVPAILGGVDDVAHFCGFDRAGAMVGRLEYRPIQHGEVDPPLSWPNL